MTKLFGHIFLKLFGWKTAGEYPRADKFVLLAAPHTSNWDLAFMIAISFVYGVRLRWMGKHTLFTPPFGYFMRWLGGLPIERHKRSNMVHKMIEHFENNAKLALTIPPEGTRKRSEYWKSGFYRIAQGANVPVIPCFLDYKNKSGGLGPAINLSDNLTLDMDKFRAFYADKTAKFPRNFAVPRLREEELQAIQPSSVASTESSCGLSSDSNR